MNTGGSRFDPAGSGFDLAAGSNNICDETAHYLMCPILINLVCEACHIETRVSLHDLI